jgi:hypothetical protein
LVGREGGISRPLSFGKIEIWIFSSWEQVMLNLIMGRVEVVHYGTIVF